MKAFEAEGDDVAPGETVSIMEITMRNLHATGGEVDLGDFISRADVLADDAAIRCMISDYFEYYRLAAYLFRYTQRRIARDGRNARNPGSSGTT